jgi:hypothetical protein
MINRSTPMEEAVRESQKSQKMNLLKKLLLKQPKSFISLKDEPCSLSQ